MNPEPFLIAHFEGVAVISVCVVSFVIALVSWQLRVLHGRIDKHAEEARKAMREHDAENREFRETVLQRLSHIEANVNGKIKK